MMPSPVKHSTRHLAYSALLLALALLLSYVESLVPLPLALPGVKLGLPNVAIMFAFFHVGCAAGAAVSLLRVLMVSLLFGSAVSFLFSAFGAMLAFAVLVLLSLTKRFGRIGVSVACAAAHGIGQLLAAALLYGVAVFSYLPVLLFAALPFGTLCGVLLYACETLLPPLRFL
ncbi:MAG: Gx transporter family protein [Clostridia bacterium]|nr:Gx transporter family protein [Clostridia bacterium]